MNEQDCGDDREVFKLVGFDPSGARRVRGCDYDPVGAREQCMQEAVEYVRAYPDTGPLSAWRFEFR
jgi:hypothetical protein